MEIMCGTSSEESRDLHKAEEQVKVAHLFTTLFWSKSVRAMKVSDTEKVWDVGGNQIKFI